LGTPEVAAKSLKILWERSHSDSSGVYEIVAAVSNPPARKGRGKKVFKSPVNELADQLGVECLTPETAKQEDFLQRMEDLEVDLCITAAYGQYLPKRFLRAPKFGTLNVHPSLLPLWRGASPVQRSLEAGDEVTGVSVLFTVTKMDAGPIVAQEERRLEGDETAPELLMELFEKGTNLLVDSLPAVFDGSATPSEQNEEDATAAAKISKEDAKCDPSVESALAIHNQARGFAEWPGTWVLLSVDGMPAERFRIARTRALPADADGKPAGKEVALVEQRARLTCGDGSVLEIEQLQPPTKKMMPASAWWNGLRGRRVQWAAVEAEEEAPVSP